MENLAFFILMYFIIGFICALTFAFLAIQEGSFERDEFIICVKLTALGALSIFLIAYVLITFDDSSEHEDYGHIDDSQEH